jgi:hypothetical protein
MMGRAIRMPPIIPGFHYSNVPFFPTKGRRQGSRGHDGVFPEPPLLLFLLVLSYVSQSGKYAKTRWAENVTPGLNFI